LCIEQNTPVYFAKEYFGMPFANANMIGHIVSGLQVWLWRWLLSK